MLNGGRRLTSSDYSKDTVSNVPLLGGTLLDKVAFLISYHLHTPISEVYKMSCRRREIIYEFLKEQKDFEKKEAESASRRH